MPDLRVAVWTPLPPQRSGIADHNAMLLPYLARHAQVSVVIEDELDGVITVPSGVRPITPTGYHARRDAFDAHVYHIGNHRRFHRAAYDAARHMPGVVVLHDTNLLHLFALVGQHELHEQLRDEYGTVNVPAMEDPSAPHMVRRLVDANEAVIVHSQTAAEQLSLRHPTTPIHAIPLAAEPTGLGDRHRLCHELELEDPELIIGVLGSFSAHKHHRTMLHVFESLLHIVPGARLVVAGWAQEPNPIEEVERLAVELDIERAVRVVTDLTPEEMQLCIGGIDVLLDLRGHGAGGTPATMLRGFAAGKPAVVTDLPHLSGLPSTFCRRVPTSPFAGARAAVKLLHELASDETLRARVSRASHEWATEYLNPERVAARYVEVLEEVAGRPRVVVASAPRTSVAVTIVGDPHATTGLMEAGRAQLRQLVHAGADVTFHPKIQPAATHSLTRHIDELELVPRARRHPIELWLVNLNEFVDLEEAELRPEGERRYVIASWFWELPVVPVPYTRHTHRPDEIWAPTRFVQQAISPYTPRPVRVVPPTIDVPLPPRVERSDFGLPSDAVLFFFNLDANSTVARKNPGAVVKAFARAFEEAERRGPVRLVMKCTHLEHHVSALSELQGAVRAVDGVLIGDELSRLEMNALLASIDVYVSLHRSEGFGLGMAEAMYLGKPVIATAYSGNTDFMTAHNSCPVGYRMRPITTSDHRFFPPAVATYQPGIPWAEADIDQAARWMRMLLEQPELRSAIGARGAITIRQKYSSDAVQRVMIPYLEEASRTIQDRCA